MVLSTKWNIIQLWKGIITDTYYNMDKPWKHYAKWKKPVAKDHILYDSIYMKCPKRYMHPYVHSSTIHNSQDMETTLMSIDRWMDKEDVAHIYNGILLSLKKKQNWVICSEVDG